MPALGIGFRPNLAALLSWSNKRLSVSDNSAQVVHCFIVSVFDSNLPSGSFNGLLLPNQSCFCLLNAISVSSFSYVPNGVFGKKLLSVFTSVYINFSLPSAINIFLITETNLIKCLFY